jgi:hypothetical protein
MTLIDVEVLFKGCGGEAFITILLAIVGLLLLVPVAKAGGSFPYQAAMLPAPVEELWGSD